MAANRWARQTPGQSRALLGRGVAGERHLSFFVLVVVYPSRIIHCAIKLYGRHCRTTGGWDLSHVAVAGEPAYRRLCASRQLALVGAAAGRERDFAHFLGWFAGAWTFYLVRCNAA